MALSLASSGCFGVFRAEVPDDLLTDGWAVADTGGGKRWLGLAAEWKFVLYEFNRTAFGGPYPASLTVLSLETLGGQDKGELRNALEAQVGEAAKRQGIALHEDTRVQGERDVRVGPNTQWFVYEGTSQLSSDLFNPGQDVRIIGEVWNDDEGGISVLAVGIAQTTGQGPTGRVFPSTVSWEKIVEDPAGSIQGMAGGQGLIWNVESH